jgi:CheY-like chemotaxis protein
MDARYHIWVVDDKRANLAMIERSFDAVRPLVELRLFEDVRDFVVTLDHTLKTYAARPDFVLLDFYLRWMYGHQALTRMLRCYRVAEISLPQRAVVIAHSSHPNASALLIRNGADFSLPKIKGLPTSAALEQNFCSAEALGWMREQRQAWRA